MVFLAEEEEATLEAVVATASRIEGNFFTEILKICRYTVRKGELEFFSFSGRLL